MELFWALFTLIPLAVFGIAEYLGIKSGHPYTRYIKKWLGIEPRRRGLQVGLWLFAILWSIFSIWFLVHIAWCWPWENC